MKSFSATSIVALALALTSSASALGINCRGSANCIDSEFPDDLKDIYKQMQAAVASGNATIRFNSGDQIACGPVRNALPGTSGALCAFFQSGAQGTVLNALNYIDLITAHGCTACGSAPTNPENDVSKGQLTLNIVSNPSGEGVDEVDEDAERFENFDGDGNDSDNDFGGSKAGPPGEPVDPEPEEGGGEVERRGLRLRRWIA